MVAVDVNYHNFIVAPIYFSIVGGKLPCHISVREGVSSYKALMLNFFMLKYFHQYLFIMKSELQTLNNYNEIGRLIFSQHKNSHTIKTLICLFEHLI